jgi:hypothetical protein
MEQKTLRVRPNELEVVCLCCFLDCCRHHCCQKMFHGLAGRQMLGGFLGMLLVLNDGLWLTERLVLVLECLGHFR